jgi:hypothetical protein
MILRDARPEDRRVLVRFVTAPPEFERALEPN